MRGVHVYELVGKILMRASGSGQVPPTEYTIIRTRGTARKNQETGFWDVQLSLLTTGWDRFTFSEWFDDWSETWGDTGQVLFADGRMADFQSGHPVDVAVPTNVFVRRFETGQSRGLDPEQLRMRSTDGLPLVAVKIADRWVEGQAPNDRWYPVREVQYRER